MKKVSFYITASLLSFLLIGLASPARAQLWNKIKNEVKNRAENNVVRKSGNATDAAMDKATEKIGKSIKGNKAKDMQVEDPAIAAPSGENNTAASARAVSTASDYRNYDFVPGDKIIFQPDMSDEADAELPARFILKKGNAEIQTFEGEKILHLDAGGSVTVAPLMDHDDYLPEQFTLEFDMMYENTREDYFDQVNDFIVKFYAAGDENYDGYGLGDFIIHSNEATILGKHGTSQIKTSAEVTKALQTNNTWHHMALYFRKNIAKAYIGSSRVSATNNFPAGASKLAFRTDGRYGYKIKNVRLAAGGDDKYNKIVTDGKFITHGILFDVNKSSIKPESMGALNEIVKLMKDHADLKFEIRGHTDSDGNDEANMTLSQSRADAVKDKLVEMGIDEGRLTTKGFGESQPIDKNDSAEGKANNRRVEFVRK